eukprot:358130-Chlamydomonas_euryale.AAC.14
MRSKCSPHRPFSRISDACAAAISRPLYLAAPPNDMPRNAAWCAFCASMSIPLKNGDSCGSSSTSW